jgi:protein AATF/BFR2
MSRLTLKDQLRQLDEQDAPPPTLDPESAYTSLDSNDISARAGDEGREHYLDVGPSKLRAQRSDVSQSLLGDKYEGKRVGRMKIFDDDEDEDEAAPFGAVEDDEDEESNMGSDDDGEDDDGDEDEEDDEEEGDEDDEDDDDDDEEEDEEDEGDEEEEEEGRAGRPQVSVPTVKTASRALDPVGALREARMKDLEKGRGIKRQKVSWREPSQT